MLIRSPSPSPSHVALLANSNSRLKLCRFGANIVPYRQSFNLEFEFANSATWEGLGDGDLISISSSLYN